MHLSPKGIVAVSQYRKVGVNFTPAGGPTRERLLGGLSRVMGNYHARFLGGLGLATAPGYPVISGIMYRIEFSIYLTYC